MIAIHLFSGEGETEIDYGIHSFLAVPRAKERVLALVDERTKRFFVEEVLHYADGSGSMRLPARISLRVVAC